MQQVITRKKKQTLRGFKGQLYEQKVKGVKQIVEKKFKTEKI